MDTFVAVDMYIFIVVAFLWTPLIKNQILRYVVYKPHLLLLLFIYIYIFTIHFVLSPLNSIYLYHILDIRL